MYEYLRNGKVWHAYLEGPRSICNRVAPEYVWSDRLEKVVPHLYPALPLMGKLCLTCAGQMTRELVR